LEIDKHGNVKPKLIARKKFNVKKKAMLKNGNSVRTKYYITYL